ncbi:MAG: winged helix-turn-helix domain-containing protein [Myxococcota bacterium]
MRIRFGRFELDDERLILSSEGRAIALRPKVFDLLLVLVRERTRVVRREELFARLWSTTAVGFGSLSGLVNELRNALGESGRGPSSIRTVHARGYQFVASAIELTDDDAALGGQGLERPIAELGYDSTRGARAVVECLPSEAERFAWLAERAGEALSVGFRLRFATASRLEPCEVGSASGGQGGLSAASTEAEIEPTADPGTTPGTAHGEDAPIALLLDVADPAAWHRAGGLRRLLDLFGRTQVLVLAVLACPSGDPVSTALIAADERIERFARRPAQAPAPLRLGAGGSEQAGRDDAADALARMLRGLARAGGPSFEAALRSLGFAAVAPEPIRSPRRVEPPAVRTAAPRRVEGLAGWADAVAPGRGVERGLESHREPAAGRRGP